MDKTSVMKIETDKPSRDSGPTTIEDHVFYKLRRPSNDQMARRIYLKHRCTWIGICPTDGRIYFGVTFGNPMHDLEPWHGSFTITV